MLIRAVQYRRPDGNRFEGNIEISDLLKEKYETMTDCGCLITFEIILFASSKITRTLFSAFKVNKVNEGDVHVCIENSEETFDSRVVNNGPEIIKAVEEMIGNFDQKVFIEWKKQLELTH